LDSQLSYYADTYEENRADFRAVLGEVKNYWPTAELSNYPVETEDEGLTIDLIRALPGKECKQLIFLSTGLHGIEGYVGAAVVKLFVKEYLRHLNPADTGLYLVHAINPWGMKHRRRVNENNVDLNRNFIFEQGKGTKELNRAYDRAHSFLNPQKPLKSASNPFFYLKLFHQILCMGPANFREAVLYGQYRYPQGLYYGGSGFERSTEVLSNLFQEAASSCERFLLIDMHSGYGPRYQMTLVNSLYEKRASADLQAAFDYPLVAKTDLDEFYPMQGDMVDYLYQVMESQFPGKYFYATSFEFGTFGSSFGAVVRSLKAMINENRVSQYGAASDQVAVRAKNDFCELFYSAERKWREKVLQDARTAFNGILKAEKFIEHLERGMPDGKD
jgi:hypothetical protein